MFVHFSGVSQNNTKPPESSHTGFGMVGHLFITAHHIQYFLLFRFSKNLRQCQKIPLLRPMKGRRYSAVLLHNYYVNEQTIVLIIHWLLIISARGCSWT